MFPSDILEGPKSHAAAVGSAAAVVVAGAIAACIAIAAAGTTAATGAAAAAAAEQPQLEKSPLAHVPQALPQKQGKYGKRLCHSFMKTTIDALNIA